MTDLPMKTLKKWSGDFAADSYGRRRRARATSLEWLGKCQTDKQGKPLLNLANAMIALRSDPTVKDAFAYDEMLCAVMLMKSYCRRRLKFQGTSSH